jgi:hypothetical protein
MDNDNLEWSSNVGKKPVMLAPNIEWKFKKDKQEEISKF